jgi:hypothetical protein
MYVQGNIEARKRIHYFREKKSVTCSGCVSVALFIQHAMRIHRIVLPSVVCVAVPYFSTLSHKRHNFRKTLLNIKCAFGFLRNLCLKNLSFSEE